MSPKSKIKISSNRSFGLIFFVVFFIIALWPLINDGQIRTLTLCFSLAFLILGLINSKLLTPLNQLWFKFGMVLGAIVAPIVMGIIFFLVVTPIGLVLRMMGKDLLNKKCDKKKTTYWIKRDQSFRTMKRQF